MVADSITPESFVQYLYSKVYISNVAGTVQNLTSPPGKAPRKRVMELHNWFTQLTKKDQAMVEKAMAYCADGAIFHTLCVLDNVSSLTTSDREFRVKVVENDVERDLIPEDEYDELHGLFRSFVDEELD